MKKLLLILTLGISLTSCEKFLDENPNRNGNNPISSIDQLDNMMNEMNYFLKGSSYGWGTNKNFATTIASDDFEFHPEIQAKEGAKDVGLITILDNDYMTYAFSQNYEIGVAYTHIYHLNTILANIDKVSGSAELKSKISAEAKAYRAYFHFQLLLTYSHHPALNGGNNPGVTYRTNISFVSPELESRGTVAAAMTAIYKDLNESLAALEGLNETTFNPKYNWRINKVNLMAIKARIDLYNGKYKDAYDAANYALSQYSHLSDFNSDDVAGVDAYYKYNNAVTINSKDGQPISYNVSWIYKNQFNEFQANDLELFVPEFTNSPFGGNFPISESLFNAYNIKSDLRLEKFFNNNAYINSISVSNFTKAEYDAIATWKMSNYQGVTRATSSISLRNGPSVPEMMLIKAECLSRGEGMTQDVGAAKAILTTLRAKRFVDVNDADNIQGDLQSVLSERRREMPYVIRWYDLKRLNALDNAGIVLSKKYFTDPRDASSAVKVYSFQPNSNYYVLPIVDAQLTLLPGWEQNPK